MEQWSKDLIAAEQAVSLDGLFLHRVRRSPKREAYRWFDRATGTWRSLTWAEIAAQAGRWRQALTGDQARLIGRHIQITGRLKDILVLSNGEKVPPADMEMAIGLDPLFEHAMVLGEGKPFLSALLVLNADRWPSLARDYQLDPKDPASLHDQSLNKAILVRVRAALADFPGYAKIRRVTLALEPWSIDNGMLTPTMKVKRHQVVQQHQNLIERMYAQDG